MASIVASKHFKSSMPTALLAHMNDAHSSRFLVDNDRKSLFRLVEQIYKIEHMLLD
jgi:hypothetical protein